MTQRTIINRGPQIEALTRMSTGGGRHLALLYGRRRVGKTWLLTNLWSPKQAFYFTASATSPAINRNVLISEAASWSGDELRPEDHPTWRTVLRALFEMNPDSDLVVVLDEFQYLADDERGLREVTSELNAVWEGKLRRTGGLLVVLSGSAVRTLEALRQGGSPIYGRIDWADRLKPFDYWNAGQMVPAFSPTERIRTWAAFGGTPKYLADINDGDSLPDNIVRLLLSPSGSVRLQLETLLGQEEGLREPTRYRSILSAVGLKRRTLGEISATLGEELSTTIRAQVGTLVDLGFLESTSDFDEPANRRLRYRISDPALRMYHGIVLPNESAIAAAGAQAVWDRRLADQVFPTYVGQHAFEDVVGQAWLRLAPGLDLPAIEGWSRWAGKDRDRREIEIDLVARTLDGRMVTGSAKMRSKWASSDVLLDHMTALQRLADSGRSWAARALEPDSIFLMASASGFTKSFRHVADGLPQQVVSWDAEALFKG